jgi:DNA-binding transcriptional regulator YiaG
MKLKYKSKIFKMLHEDATGLFEIGAISEKRMREYDRACLVQEAQPKPKAARTAKRALSSA